MKKDALSLNFLLLVVLALIWGSSYILMKKGLESFSALQVSMLRILFACLALLPFLPKIANNIVRKDIKYALLVALLGSGIPSYLYPLAITKVDSSVTGIINTLTPLFTMLFAWAFFQFKPTSLKVISLIIALFGASLLIVNGLDASKIELNYYALAAVLATICYGFSSNVLKAKLDHVKSIPLTALTFFLIGPIAAIILFSGNFLEVMQTDEHASLSLMYVAILGVLGTAAALVLYNLLIKRTDAVYASSVTFMMPIIALAWGFLDHEPIAFRHIFGLLFILLGVFLSNIYPYLISKR
jgi:drug/metabolite transporter (DMT)-like permease